MLFVTYIVITVSFVHLFLVKGFQPDWSAEGAFGPAERHGCNVALTVRG